MICVIVFNLSVNMTSVLSVRASVMTCIDSVGFTADKLFMSVTDMRSLRVSVGDYVGWLIDVDQNEGIPRDVKALCRVWPHRKVDKSSVIGHRLLSASLCHTNL
jgi:hypothetical protein